MKQIIVAKTKLAMVDDEDYLYLSRFNWTLSAGHPVKETRSAKSRDVTFMVEFIVQKPHSQLRYYFKDRNPLNLMKSNIEVRTYSTQQVGLPKCRKRCSSIYKGVSFDKRSNRWQAYIENPIEGKRNRISKMFDTEREAAIWRNKIASTLYGDLAYQNIIN